MTEVEGMIRIGGFLIEQPYGDGEGKLAIYRYQDGEGGDFDARPAHIPEPDGRDEEDRR